VSLIFLGAAVHFVLPYLTTLETARRTLSNLWGIWLFAALAAQVFHSGFPLSLGSSQRLILNTPQGKKKQHSVMKRPLLW